jgi:glycine cleavage system aminomethyltransferase T
VGRSIALAWLPRTIETGDAVAIAYFDRMLLARLADEPLFDPSGERLRA